MKCFSFYLNKLIASLLNWEGIVCKRPQTEKWNKGKEWNVCSEIATNLEQGIRKGKAGLKPWKGCERRRSELLKGTRQGRNIPVPWREAWDGQGWAGMGKLILHGSGDEFCVPVGEPDQFIKTGCGLDCAAAAQGDIWICMSEGNWLWLGKTKWLRIDFYCGRKLIQREGGNHFD